MPRGQQGQDGAGDLTGGPSPVVGGELAKAAVAGDQDAWNAIVDRCASLVWSVARGRHLSEGRASEVCRVTWLRLMDQLRTIPPEEIVDWLQVTAERESVRVATLRWAETDGQLRVS